MSADVITARDGRGDEFDVHGQRAIAAAHMAAWGIGEVEIHQLQRDQMAPDMGFIALSRVHINGIPPAKLYGLS